jgi:hypothetical protein
MSFCWSSWFLLPDIAVAQKYRPQHDFIPIKQQCAIFGDGLAVDQCAAGALLIKNAVAVSFLNKRGVEAGDGGVLAEGVVGVPRRTAESRFALR